MKTAYPNLSMPALLSFPFDHALLVQAWGDAKEVATQAIQALLLRLLANVPPGKLRFTFIDPIGLGQSVAPFLHLADYDEQLVTNKAWSEQRHIEQQLINLTEHMENVIQKYLRNEYATIEDYNAHAGEIAEPYRVLVVYDFPANFSEEMSRRLISIAQNGPRCGVHTVILADMQQPLPYGFNLEDLKRVSTTLEWDGQHFAWREELYKHYYLDLEMPPVKALFDHILREIGEAARMAAKVEVPFDRIALPRDQWWSKETTDGVSIPLGPSGARSVQNLELGRGTAQHALVVGRTGSGKSTLLHTLITGAALNYSPDELELYLIDLKKGVEFKTYATHQLPHARVVAIESEREFALSVLQGLDAELKRRGDLFRSEGVDGLSDHRRRTSEEMPRILLLVDEFQELFTEDDNIASSSQQIIDRLVRQGRGFGIHVLLCSQTLAGYYTLTRSTIDQMAVRIALQCTETDSRLILADDNPAARLLSRPGEAIYNAANGLVEGNNRFQVAWLPDEERDHYLKQVQEHARQTGKQSTQIVFEGNAAARIESNRPLERLLTAGVPTEAVYPVLAFLGDPVAIREPAAASFRRQSGCNLLIVGRNEEEARGMSTAALISLAAQLPVPDSEAGGVTFNILDMSAPDAPNARLFKEVADILPHPVRIGRRSRMRDMFSSLEMEVKRRIDADEVRAPSQFLFVYGLQRARELRQEDAFGFSSYGEKSVEDEPSKQFETILRDGPEVGVHTLVWCDRVTNLNRSIDRKTLWEFALRVASQMNPDDSVKLIDTPAASKLGAHRALFYDEEEIRLEKMRPYLIPSKEWLLWVKARFQQI